MQQRRLSDHGPSRHRALLLPMLCLTACDMSPGRPVTPADEIAVVVPASRTTAPDPLFDERLAEPIVYLGRPETIYRVRRVVDDSWSVLRHVSTAILVDAMPRDEDAAGVSWPRVDPVASGSLQVDSSARTTRWSVFENVFLEPQTIIRVGGVLPEDGATIRRLVDRLRGELEASLVRHQAARLSRQPGAAALPRRATQAAFRMLLPLGYAWSDTSTGWPQSVQVFTTHPTRIVSVFWLEEARSEWLSSPEFLLGFVRDAIWRLQQDRLAADSVDWLGNSRQSPTLQAVWQNPEAIAGGPMQVRFAYDAARRRLYGVQALVFLPGADKHRAMREVNAVASTFEILE